MILIFVVSYLLLVHTIFGHEFGTIWKKLVGAYCMEYGFLQYTYACDYNIDCCQLCKYRIVQTFLYLSLIAV
jgi:hypothetical protein